MFPMDPTIRKIAKESLSIYWPRFVLMVSTRLHKGRADYGDNSFASPLHKTVRQIREELWDVAGWAFVLDCQLEAMEQRLKEVDEAYTQAVKTCPSVCQSKVVNVTH